MVLPRRGPSRSDKTESGCPRLAESVEWIERQRRRLRAVGSAGRLALAYGVALAIGVALPIVAGLDEWALLAVNVGTGPEWWYSLIHPHVPRYAALTALAAAVAGVTHRSLRAALVAALACTGAGLAALALLEPLQIIFARDRPEEVLGAAIERAHDRSWAPLPSYPSGHAMVTAAIVASARDLVPRLGPLLIAWLLAVAISRLMFGAHFPTDVAVGALLGWSTGRLVARLTPAPFPVGRRASHPS